MCTEASVDLVEHPELLNALPEAGFNLIFCGTETLSLEALLTMKKRQNTRKTEGGHEEYYLLHAVRKIHAKGIEVAAGFILGADGDTEDSFDAHIEFIQTAGVVMAMEGLLTVLKETALYKRYDPTLSNYFDRCWVLIQHLPPAQYRVRRVGKRDLKAFLKTVWRQLLSRQGVAYTRFLSRVLRYRPRMFPEVRESDQTSARWLNAPAPWETLTKRGAPLLLPETSGLHCRPTTAPPPASTQTVRIAMKVLGSQ